MIINYFGSFHGHDTLLSLYKRIEEVGAEDTPSAKYLRKLTNYHINVLSGKQRRKLYIFV